MARKHVKVTAEMADRAVRETDWRAIDAMTDADIARQVAENPDAAPLLNDAEILAARLRGLRLRMKLSQGAFAARFRISASTLREWEQGRRRPDQTALSYLRVIEREPDAVRRALAAE